MAVEISFDSAHGVAKFVGEVSYPITEEYMKNPEGFLKEFTRVAMERAFAENKDKINDLLAGWLPVLVERLGKDLVVAGLKELLK